MFYFDEQNPLQLSVDCDASEGDIQAYFQRQRVLQAVARGEMPATHILDLVQTQGENPDYFYDEAICRIGWAIASGATPS